MRRDKSSSPRARGRGMPEAFAVIHGKAPAPTQGHPSGEVKALSIEHNGRPTPVQAGFFQDRRGVVLLTTAHDLTSGIKYVDAAGATSRLQRVPTFVDAYNSCVGGVHLADLLIEKARFGGARRESHWTTSVEFNIFNMVLLNAYTVHADLHRKSELGMLVSELEPCLTHPQFRVKLVAQLMSLAQKMVSKLSEQEDQRPKPSTTTTSNHRG
jgi:hypothetical protein